MHEGHFNLTRNLKRRIERREDAGRPREDPEHESQKGELKGDGRGVYPLNPHQNLKRRIESYLLPVLRPLGQIPNLKRRIERPFVKLMTLKPICESHKEN